jgi:SSS family solute:Na+ symporter
MTPPSLAAFAALDWAVLGGYFVLLAIAGVLLAKRRETAEEYFLANHSIPVWAASLSVLATAISAATFIGAPEQSYGGNLTYLSSYIGSVVAAFVVALLFIPAFYRHNVTTVYQLLAIRFGAPSMLAASGMFLVGRLLASGAREYMAGLAASMILFNDIQPAHVVVSIVVLVVVGIVYTLVGGITSVIWTDVVQAFVFVGAAVVSIATLLYFIPADLGQIASALTHPAPGEASKLTLVTLGGGWGDRFTIFTALFGFTLIGIGANGTDHDLAQRMLTCRSAKKGAMSALVGIIVQVPVAFLFMIVGLLLYVFYKRPDLMGAAAPIAVPSQTKDVFLRFIIDQMPVGIRGLIMAGLFAAALSSFVSALNAMSSTTVFDFYRRFRPDRTERHYVRVGQLGVVAWGIALGSFAVVSVYWQEGGQKMLIDFALNIMSLAYSGLVAVFLTALLTRRGNNASVIAALATGFLTVLAFSVQPWTWFGASPLNLAFPWHMTLGTALAFIVCCLGAPAPRPEPLPVRSLQLET